VAPATPSTDPPQREAENKVSDTPFPPLKWGNVSLPSLQSSRRGINRVILEILIMGNTIPPLP